MKDSTLDKLVSLGTIAGYEYESLEDVNNRNQIISYECLVIRFNDNKKLAVYSSGGRDTSLSIE
jgi:hypothetical protein